MILIRETAVVPLVDNPYRQELGHPRQYDHPEVVSAVEEILDACNKHGVVCGNAHVDSKNVETLLEKGFRWLMTPPVYSFALLQQGLEAAGRS